MKISHLLFLLALSMLASCSVFSPIKPDQTSNYMLNRVPSNVVHKKLSHRTIMVMPSETTPAFNTTQMAYTTKSYQVAYFSQNQWAETPAQMLLPLMVQTLQDTHHYHAVITPPYLGKYDYLLTTQIIKLQQNFIAKPNTVELTVQAVLTNSNTNRVIATKEFNIHTAIPQNTPYSGVMASNEASAQFLTRLAAFCTEHS